MFTRSTGFGFAKTDSLDAFRSGNLRKQYRTPEEIVHRRRFRPLVVMYIGRRGGGKSLAMSVTSLIQQRRNKRRGAYRSQENPDGYAVAANYKLLLADYASPYLVDDLMRYELMGGDASPFNLLVNIDEAAANFPSRRSMAGANVDFSNILTQIRKLNCEVNFTTQFPQVMDLQILWQVDLFIRCRTPDHGKTIFLDYFDWWGQWTGKDFRKPWPPQPGWEDWKKVYRNCDVIWPYYDTKELQATIWSKYRDKMIEASGWEIVDARDADESELTRREMMSGKPQRGEGRKPQSVTEVLMQAGPQFAVASQLPAVREFAPELSTQRKLADYLQELGYTIKRQGGTMFAYAKTPGNTPDDGGPE